MAQSIIDPDAEDMGMVIAAMSDYEMADELGCFSGFIPIRQAVGYFNLWMLPEGKLNESWKKTKKVSAGRGESVRAEGNADAAPR